MNIVSTRAACWIVERSDGVRLGFTDHDRPLTVEGVVCEAMSGWRGSERRATLGFGADAQDVDGALDGAMGGALDGALDSALDSASITQDDVRAGRYDGARVRVFDVDWRDPSDPSGAKLEHVGIVGEIRQEDERFVAELRGLSSLLERSVARRFTRRCDADLGDKRCGVGLDDPRLRAVGAVLAVASPGVLKVSNLDAFADDWFAHGRLDVTGGANAGLSVEIVSSRAETLHLWEPLPLAVEIGDSCRVTAGCDRTFATCGAKFANRLNFRGFPHMPGETALSYAAQDVVHDGSPLVSGS